MIRSTLHNHTRHCDGKNTAKEMAQAALEASLTDFGFSGHAPAFFDRESTMASEEAYRQEIRQVQQMFQGTLRIYLGIEQDYLDPVKDRSAYDYVIGSIHNIKVEESYFTFDWTQEKLEELLAALGDQELLPQIYYEYMIDMITSQKPDIIGHFDLVRKLNAGEKYFKEGKAYQKLALDTLEVAMESSSVLELNAAGYRYRSTPYPDRFLLDRLLEKGQLVTIQADAHDTSGILANVSKAVEVLKEVGFRSSLQWIKGKWEEVGL